MGAAQVGPLDGLCSPSRYNPAVKQVHGEAEHVQGDDGRQRTRARKTLPAEAEAPTGAHIERKARAMSAVFVLDAERRPLAPVHPGRARLLLKAGKVAVFKRHPFTVILKRSVARPASQRFRLKVDPGSKTTGLALVDEETHEVVWAAELRHQGEAIVERLRARRAVRRGRTQRHTRYTQARFANRRRKGGWLPPSHRVPVHNCLPLSHRLPH